MTFDSLKLTREFVLGAEDAGYVTPTPIQEKAIPPALSGQHIIGIAQTGTGKTAAFLLPTLQLLHYAQGESPRALVLAPTKELVVQATEHAKMLSKHSNLRVAGIYGGVGKTGQQKLMREGVDLLVATPGRLMELHEDGSLNLRAIKMLIIDEADRMLDMGFLPKLEMLLDVLPRKKQVMLFSATFSDKVETLSEEFMDFPIKIEISPEATVAETIEHVQYHVPNRPTKLNLLEYLLRDNEEYNRVIVFVKTKDMANAVAARLNKNVRGPIKVLHSNKAQNTRINAFNEFREGKVRILVATDVAARGIDVSAVSHVINVDVPLAYEDYIHRIGRTGRVGLSGKAISFVNEAEMWHIEQIEKRIRQKVPLLKVPENLVVENTPFDEQQDMLREIDARRRKEDPTFKGAFHEKQIPATKVRNRSKKVIAKYGKAKSYFAPTAGSGRPKTSKHGRHKK